MVENVIPEAVENSHLLKGSIERGIKLQVSSGVHPANVCDCLIGSYPGEERQRSFVIDACELGHQAAQHILRDGERVYERAKRPQEFILKALVWEFQEALCHDKSRSKARG